MATAIWIFPANLPSGSSLNLPKTADMFRRFLFFVLFNLTTT